MIRGSFHVTVPLLHRGSHCQCNSLHLVLFYAGEWMERDVLMVVAPFSEALHNCYDLAVVDRGFFRFCHMQLHGFYVGLLIVSLSRRMRLTQHLSSARSLVFLVYGYFISIKFYDLRSIAWIVFAVWH